jgi:FAD/FMN-containing dehydrogenase
LLAADANQLFSRCVEFPVAGKSPLVLKASVLPSRVTSLVDSVLRLDPDSSIQAHAGSGVVQLRLSQLPPGGMTKGLIGTLQSAAVACGGSLVVLSAENSAEATHQSIWGTPSSPQALMTSVKRAFDPRNILNPDRFVYAGY